MKRLARYLIPFYPRQWRERYGHEFDTLLEDTNATWRQIPDILLEALKLRLTTLNWRFVATLAAAGLVIATAISFGMRERYQSVATLRMTPGPQSDPNAARKEAELNIRNVLSRTSLSNLIQSPRVELYKRERARKPLEDVIEDMKANDLKVATGPNNTLLVEYRGENPDQAQATVQLMVTRLIDEHQNRSQSLSQLARNFEQDTGRSIPVPPAAVLEVLDPPSLPTSRMSPNRAVVALSGILIGLLAALAIGIIRRAPRNWLTGASISLLVVGATNFLPLPYESQAQILFDSPATLKDLTKDHPIFLTDLGAQSLRGLDLIPDSLGTGLTIRARNTNRELAQRTLQAAISRLVEATAGRRPSPNPGTWTISGPWAEVLDPPSLPVNPMGDAWRDAIAWAAFIVALISGALLLLERRQPRLTPEPA